MPQLRRVWILPPPHGIRAAPAAARAGVQPGDLLLAIDGQPVSTVAQANVAAGRSDKSVALLVQRGARKIYVPLRLV